MPKSAITKALDFVYKMTSPIGFEINNAKLDDDGVWFEGNRVELNIYWGEGLVDLIIGVYKKEKEARAWVGDITPGFRKVKANGEEVLVPIRSRRNLRRVIETLLDTEG